MKPAGNDDWQHCGPEVIQGLVVQTQKETRRGMLKRIGVTTAGLFSVVAGGTFWWASRKPTREQVEWKLVLPIGCREVKSQLADYHFHALDDTTSRRIRCHLSKCRACDMIYREHFPDVSTW